MVKWNTFLLAFINVVNQKQEAFSHGGRKLTKETYSMLCFSLFPVLGHLEVGQRYDSCTCFTYKIGGVRHPGAHLSFSR